MYPKVSVVVPVYNVEKYLHQCIDSLLNQTYPNLEIILVDDGSTDNSGKICDEYKDNYPDIMIIHKQNEGLGFARNSGMAVATSDYVTFIDSDDYADKKMIEELMKPIIENNADTVIGGFKKVDDLGNVLFTETYEKQIYTGKRAYEDFFIRILGSKPGKHDFVRMSVWNSVYSLRLIKENQISFPSERVMISEDLGFDADYYKIASNVVILSTSMYNYRYNPGSLSEKYRSNKFQLINDLYTEMRKRINGTFKKQEEADNRLKTMYLIQIRGCIKQENISGKNRREKIESVKSICTHAMVQQVIKTYPRNKLSLKQKFFINMIKYKNCKILLLLLKYMK